MKIETIRVKNFKALRDVSMNDIPSFCVILGANGSGKSTLFSVFSFLKDCLTFNISRALQARGGFHEVISRGCSDDDVISIELQFRMEIAGVSRRVTYVLEIGNNKTPYVRREILKYKRKEYGSPYHFLQFKNGKGYAITNEEDFSKDDNDLDREEQSLDSSNLLAIKGLGQFERFKAASAFRQMIENWHISDFHISDARGGKDAAGYEEHLSDSGDNLQRVARYMYENYPDRWNDIIDKMKSRVPGVSSVETKLMDNGQLILKFGDGAFKEPFVDRFVSDGTLKMFAYLVLLHDPRPHPVLCVEEPENQLYPKLLTELAEEFEDYARRGGQVFVSTHSPDFLNAVEVGSVYWLVKKNGQSQIYKAQDDEQVVSFMRQGDKMGYLWKQGLLKDVDPV